MENKNDTINFVKAVESQNGKYVIITFVRFMGEKKEYLKWIVPTREISKPDKPYIYGTLLDLMKVAKPAPNPEMLRGSAPVYGSYTPQVMPTEQPTSPEAELDQDPLPF